MQPDYVYGVSLPSARHAGAVHCGADLPHPSLCSSALPPSNVSAFNKLDASACAFIRICHYRRALRSAADNLDMHTTMTNVVPGVPYNIIRCHEYRNYTPLLPVILASRTTLARLATVSNRQLADERRRQVAPPQACIFIIPPVLFMMRTTSTFVFSVHVFRSPDVRSRVQRCDTRDEGQGFHLTTPPAPLYNSNMRGQARRGPSRAHAEPKFCCELL